MPKYRITVKPSARPNEGEWQFHVHIIGGRHGTVQEAVAEGYGSSNQFATEAAYAAAARHADNPTIIHEVEYE